MGASTVTDAFAPQDLLRADAYPHPVAGPQLIETPISWVFLTGIYAYKVKKALSLEYLDTTTLERRLHLCREELRLNQRFSADLYLEVVPVTRDADGLRIGGSGAVVDYAVRMQQFDRREELHALLVGGGVSRGEIETLAQDVADFHDRAEVAVAGDHRRTQHLYRAVLGTLATLLARLPSLDGLPELGTLTDWTHDYLGAGVAEFQWREDCGQVRECHGDLHARNVVRRHGRLTPFDCLEFDADLRWIDTMSDVAFLLMDLDAHDRRDLAQAFLDRYLERTGDYAGVRLLRFYAVYRALVRAMVDAIALEGLPDPRDHAQRLQRRVKSAANFVARPPPMLVLMHGLSGSGKTFLGGALAAHLECIRIRSDVERRRLARPDAPIGYDAAARRRVYARLLDCADACLAGGYPVLVDASFLDGSERRMFRELAQRQRVRCVIVHCEAEIPVLRRRLALRAAAGTDASQAGIAVLEEQLKCREPLSAEEARQTVSVRTDQPDPLAAALTAVGRLLTGTPSTL
jgi:aminoglycoside phosphotransferase family enzyme/predicted kinase